MAIKLSLLSNLNSCFSSHCSFPVMQSAGSTSSQPPSDTLSSGDSFLFSDDDSEVFLLEEGEGRSSRSACSLDGGLESPGSQWAQDGFGEASGVSGGHSRSASDSSSSISFSSSTSSSGLGWSGAESIQSEGGKEKEKAKGSQGDTLFAQKVRISPTVLPSKPLMTCTTCNTTCNSLIAYQQPTVCKLTLNTHEKCGF